MRGLRILEAPLEPEFDGFVERAARAFVSPIASLTLIQGDRLWVKASVGLPLVCAPRDETFCTFAVDRQGAFEVCDAQADPFFSTLASVTGAPFIRYYIGAPLKLSGGMHVGALCALDTRPRRPASADQRAYLAGLARQAAEALERHAHLIESLAA